MKIAALTPIAFCPSAFEVEKEDNASLIRRK
jgi:hypothetical protein